MDFYFHVAKFFHVSIAILWVGGATGMIWAGVRAMRANDPKDVATIVRHTRYMADHVFMPGSILMLLLGLFMVYVNGEGFQYTSAWVDIGILGILTTATIGATILTPGLKKIEAAETEEAADAASHRLLTQARADMVLLWTIIYDMVMKPQWSNPIEILVMAAVVVGAGFYFLRHKV